MAKFNYVALDAKGKEINGIVESDSATTNITIVIRNAGPTDTGTPRETSRPNCGGAG